MSVLLNTKLRKNLFTYTFTHHDEDFYVRELAVLIGADPGNLSRELIKLEQEGIYKTFKRGREKFYSINKDYTLYNEFKNIIFKTEGLEGSLEELVLKYKGIETAFIYGSYAKGKDKRASDVDLAVVGEFAQNKFTQNIRGLESKLNREINFTVYCADEFDREKKKEGSFLNMVLKGKIIILKGKAR